MANTVSHPIPDKQLSLFDPIEIPLTRGYVALVDPVDADLAKLRWHTMTPGHSGPYATRHDWGRRIKVLMHRVVLSRMLNKELLPTELADHINGNTLDNRRSNLRLATLSQNIANQKRHKDNQSGYKGVTRRRNKWSAEIYFDHKSHNLGCFDTPTEAYAAYCEAAIKYHGEFARLK